MRGVPERRRREELAWLNYNDCNHIRRMIIVRKCIQSIRFSPAYLLNTVFLE